MTIYEEVLVGAIDLHCHIDLEFTQHAFRKREPEWEWLPKAEALGIRGFVLKSHWWPTAAAVPYLKQLYQGTVELFSSIVLNPVSGGAELWAVESAVGLGARMVFLPTWGACHDLEHQGFHTRIIEAVPRLDPARVQGVRFVDEAGRLTTGGHELLRYCHEHDLTLGSGHVSWQETLAFAEEARAIGFRRLVFTHPLAPFIGTPLDGARRAAELGVWLEFCWTQVAPGRMDPAEAVAWIRDVGVDHVVVSTDYFRGSTPNPPELFRFLLGTLYEAGLSPDELRRMATVNPARALGLAEP
jgi:hypothetical protein